LPRTSDHPNGLPPISGSIPAPSRLCIDQNEQSAERVFANPAGLSWFAVRVWQVALYGSHGHNLAFDDGFAPRPEQDDSGLEDLQPTAFGPAFRGVGVPGSAVLAFAAFTRDGEGVVFAAKLDPIDPVEVP